MRFRVDLAAERTVLRWEDVFTPARAVAYDLIRGQDAELAAELHSRGYAGSSLRPLGICSPQFHGTLRSRGTYTTSANGSLWLGSPVPRISSALLAGIAGKRSLRWASLTLSVRGVQLEPTPDHLAGEALFSTRTPVLIKWEDRYIHPDHPQFAERLSHNLRHKADFLGLPAENEVEVVSSGPPRKFLVQRAPRHGSTAELRIRADPTLLDAVYDWGLGLSTNQGFGWIR
ncbi:CRISPR-associated endoribonuclease Cas6 [Frankia sp. Ag45/Mut15]|uniref:CRISPR-associated endoribonuclease Cas6 n=1 Tax=Frankia umida TaxID=573489 RepID=A0ABT0K521_9ACTN|nr:CRISPR-associated endoribonuclease Cas6 [Frankia umida]MCK9878899.1 CRISPR-associated endoribonuclease Cas6 [Frankia umida]